MNLISMDKKYRRRGGTQPVRVLCIDASGYNPVVYLDEHGKPTGARDDGIFLIGAAALNNPHDNDLVEYIEPKVVPLGPEDIPIGSAISKMESDGNIFKMVIQADNTCLYFGRERIDYCDLVGKYRINRNDGKGWVACEKQAKE